MTYGKRTQQNIPHNPQANRQDWQKDPRLSGLPPQKLELLSAFAAELANAAPDARLGCFLSLQKRAAAQQISFTDEEKHRIIAILIEQLSPEDRKKAQMIQTMAARSRRS